VSLKTILSDQERREGALERGLDVKLGWIERQLSAEKSTDACGGLDSVGAGRDPARPATRLISSAW
jgi:hypothetical protein